MTDYDEARRTLVRLLHWKYDAPVFGVENYNAKENQFMIATCAATVLLHTISRVANYHEEDAQEGLKALELERNLADLCEEYACGDVS